MKFLWRFRSTKFPDYSNNNCVNDAYQGFVTKFLSVTDSVVATRTFESKTLNIKPWFDIDILHVIPNRDKEHCKKFK